MSDNTLMAIDNILMTIEDIHKARAMAESTKVFKDSASQMATSKDNLYPIKVERLWTGTGIPISNGGTGYVTTFSDTTVTDDTVQMEWNQTAITEGTIFLIDDTIDDTLYSVSLTGELRQSHKEVGFIDNPLTLLLAPILLLVGLRFVRLFKQLYFYYIKRNIIGLINKQKIVKCNFWGEPLGIEEALKSVSEPKYNFLSMGKFIPITKRIWFFTKFTLLFPILFFTMFKTNKKTHMKADRSDEGHWSLVVSSLSMILVGIYLLVQAILFFTAEDMCHPLKYTLIAIASLIISTCYFAYLNGGDRGMCYNFRKTKK